MLLHALQWGLLRCSCCSCCCCWWWWCFQHGWGGPKMEDIPITSGIQCKKVPPTAETHVETTQPVWQFWLPMVKSVPVFSEPTTAPPSHSQKIEIWNPFTKCLAPVPWHPPYPAAGVAERFGGCDLAVPATIVRRLQRSHLECLTGWWLGGAQGAKGIHTSKGGGIWSQWCNQMVVIRNAIQPAAPNHFGRNSLVIHVISAGVPFCSAPH